MYLLASDKGGASAVSVFYVAPAAGSQALAGLFSIPPMTAWHARRLVRRVHLLRCKDCPVRFLADFTGP